MIREKQYHIAIVVYRLKKSICIVYMATIEKKHIASKYSDLSEEEKKQKYKEKVKEWYENKSLEEKKEYMRHIKEIDKGYCEICNNNRLYHNLSQHRRTQWHLKKVEEANKNEIQKK